MITRRWALAGIATLAAVAVGQGGIASAQTTTAKLPSTLAWTAYDVGTSGYNQSVAIGKALKDKLGTDLRVLPGKNDISRTIPLREGQVQFSATGVGGSYFAQEGAHEFGAKGWGPQPVRLLLSSNPETNLSVGTAADAGIKMPKDLKGKRVAWIVGAPALNENVTAFLAFAGLTWDDVKKVEVGGNNAGWDALINGQADAMWGQTTSGKAYQLESSPRGLFWPPLPHSDKEGWARAMKLAPYWIPQIATEGAGITKQKTHEGATYPYPILTAMADQNPDLVYNMTKAMIELYPLYKDGAPGASGWALNKQKLDWVVPYHEGAIRYLKEANAWTDEAQKHNDKLLERQKVLKAAWEQMAKEKTADDEAHMKRWLQIRAAALDKAGFDPVWR